MARTAKDGLTMAKKPVVSYAGLALGTDQGNAEAGLTPAAVPLPKQPPGKSEGRTLKESSTHLMLYLNPPAAKALKRYALDQNVKVHDLLIEAVEDWFRTHVLKEQVRAEMGRRRSGG